MLLVSLVPHSIKWGEALYNWRKPLDESSDEGLRTSDFITIVLTFAIGFHKFAQREWAHKQTLIIQVT